MTDFEINIVGAIRFLAYVSIGIKIKETDDQLKI